MTGASPTYRMRDLVRLTGLSAATIHFYAQQGLLPAPHKTAGNQALYSEATVRRIRWVRALQTELKLSLRSIARVLARHGELSIEEVGVLVVLGSLLDEPDPVAGRDDLEAVSRRLGADDVGTLRRLGLVSAGSLTGSDLRLLELVAAMRASGLTEEAGFSIETLAVYRDAVAQLVSDELARIVEPVLLRHEPAVLRDLVNRALPLTDRLLSLLHQRAVRAEMQQWIDVDDDVATA